MTATSPGYIVDTHCQDFGIALAMLGGGREKKEDPVDHGVGLEFHKRIGDRVEAGETLVTIHYNSDDKAGRGQGNDCGELCVRRSGACGEAADSAGSGRVRL